MGVPRKIAIALEIDQPYPQHQEVFAGVQRYAAERAGWRCLIDEHPMHQAGRRGPDYGRYDGVIARADPAMQQRLKRRGIPLVNVLYQTARPGVPGVYPDSLKLGQTAAGHLVERGFRSICYMGEIKQHRHTGEVARTFVACGDEAGITTAAHHIPNPAFLDPTAWLETERLLEGLVAAFTPPVGVFVEEAPIARLVIERCMERGLDVPRDIAVLSQHNLKAVVGVSPQISSIEIDNQRAGYEAARLLDRLMKGEAGPDQPILIPPLGVVGRESTDYFAVEDELVASALLRISENLGHTLTVESLAYELAVSPRTLQSRFAAQLGRGVSQEIRRLRLEKAKRLLVEPGTPIAEVAKRSGFSRPQLFNAVFLREMGKTPTAYRVQVLGEREPK